VRIVSHTNALLRPLQHRQRLYCFFEVADFEKRPGGLVDQEAQFVAASTQVTQGALRFRYRPIGLDAATFTARFE
jgi:hypothetical protein